jgi:hypothetical protein
MRLIQEAISKQAWEEGRELIKDGRKEELKKGIVNLTTDWDELLLKIAKEENDVKAIRNLSLQLFLSSDNDFGYYYLMKQHYELRNGKLKSIELSLRSKEKKDLLRREFML